MEKNSEEISQIKYTFQEILLFVLTAFVSVAAAYFYKKTLIEGAGIVILTVAGMGGVLFVIEQTKENGVQCSRGFKRKINCRYGKENERNQQLIKGEDNYVLYWN